jgi:glutamate 5-kinase
MRSKLEAARLATHAGSALLISDGIEEHALIDLSRNSERKSTWFYPVGNPAKARKRWIESHLKTAGVITIDDGALTALQKGKSLLPIGVTSVKGSFDRGDAVSVRSNDGKEVAVGLAAFNSFEAQKIAGLKSHEVEKILGYSGRSEMIHRNDLAILLKNRISLSN